jgi:hypothetical protein
VRSSSPAGAAPAVELERDDAPTEISMLLLEELTRKASPEPRRSRPIRPKIRRIEPEPPRFAGP